MTPSTTAATWPHTGDEPAGFTWRVSTRSASAGGNCVEVGRRTSSRSANTGGNCVEVGPVRPAAELVAVRDSKDRAGGMFTVTTRQWTAFVSALTTDALHPAP